ncbi:MAG: class IV adenylate cyclase [Methanobacteriota archaeon]
MGLEVELKAPCDGKILEMLKGVGAKFNREEIQVDRYFNHPSRDFKNTGEALRIRCVGDCFYLTYKGPKLSGKLKVREEYEMPVTKDFKMVLEKLGFSEVGKIGKARRIYDFEGLIICIDRVDGLGLFIEIESESLEMEGKIVETISKLGVDEKTCTTKSYLELILGKKG